MQVLAFDFGTKRIGVAVGQSITATAQPLATLNTRDGAPPWDMIQQYLKEWQPQILVVGLPLNMDGSEQDLTQMARRFANRLHGRFQIQVEMQDERLTSVEARQQIFDERGYKGLKQSQIDSIAACLILEDWFANSH